MSETFCEIPWASDLIALLEAAPQPTPTPQEESAIPENNLLLTTTNTVEDCAETLALQILMKTKGTSMHIHRTGIGPPCWDIDYKDHKGKLQRIEVKGTQAAAFRNIKITANE